MHLVLLAALGACDAAPTLPVTDEPATPRPGAPLEIVPGREGCAFVWSGITWCVRDQAVSGPGPNRWDPRNVWVDIAGRLHLAIVERDGVWTSAELASATAHGFGDYEFVLGSAVGDLDPNVVLGLFTYPNSGGDGLHEIDIEFARWGRTDAGPLNYTVYPAVRGLTMRTRNGLPWRTEAARSMHRFTREPARVHFASYDTPAPTLATRPVATWTHEAALSSGAITQGRWPLHLNLWLFRGQPPTNGRAVEVIVEAVRYRGR